MSYHSRQRHHRRDPADRLLAEIMRDEDNALAERPRPKKRRQRSRVPFGKPECEPLGQRDVRADPAAIDSKSLPIVSHHRRNTRNSRAEDLSALEETLACIGINPISEAPGLSIMDRDFDFFDRKEPSDYGNARTHATERFGSTEQTRRCRERELIHDKYQNYPLHPPRRRSSSRTSGFRLPPHATSCPRIPEYFETPRRMGNPTADVLIGARPDYGRIGTPMAWMEEYEDGATPECRAMGPWRRR